MSKLKIRISRPPSWNIQILLRYIGRNANERDTIVSGARRIWRSTNKLIWNRRFDTTPEERNGWQSAFYRFFGPDYGRDRLRPHDKTGTTQNGLHAAWSSTVVSESVFLALITILTRFARETRWTVNRITSVPTHTQNVYVQFSCFRGRYRISIVSTRGGKTRPCRYIRGTRNVWNPNRARANRVCMRSHGGHSLAVSTADQLIPNPAGAAVLAP